MRNENSCGTEKMTEHLMMTCMIICVRKMRLVSGKLGESVSVLIV